MVDQTPSVGRIVLFQTDRVPVDMSSGEPQATVYEISAAIVTGLNQDGTVDLAVFFRAGAGLERRFGIPRGRFNVPAGGLGTEGRYGWWNWPPRV